MGELHTHFKLANLRDSLFLFDDAKQVIDYVVPECVPDDKALGYIIGYSDRQIISPSPGRTNNESQLFEINFVNDSLFVDKPSGKYDTQVEIQFSSKYPNSSIFYTTNGNEPNDEDILFTEPIILTDISNNENRFAKKVVEYVPGDLIAKANIVRAQVYSDGCPASNVVSNTYFVGDTDSFVYDVPVISIITEKDNLFDEDKGIYVYGNNGNYIQRGSAWERSAHIEYFDAEGTQVVDQDAGIRIHGRSSRGNSQKSFRLYAKEKYGNESFDYPFFEQKPAIDQFKTLLLRTTWSDWSESFFKDQMCHKMVEDMDMDYMACQTSILFLNGEYWGIYSLRERQDEAYVANNYNIPEPELDVISFDYGATLKRGSMDNYLELIDWLQSSNPKDASFYSEAAKRIDLDNVSDYYIAEFYLAHYDFPHLNRDMWRTKADTSRWRFFFFDLDATMLKVNYDHLSNYNNNIESLQRFTDEDEYLLSRLLENDSFRSNFYAKFLRHMENTFSEERVLGLIDAYEQEYTPLVAEQAYRWGKPVDMHKWSYNIRALEDFAQQRPVIMMGQLLKNFNNPFKVYPNPNQGEFTIAMTNDELIGVNYVLFNAQGNPVSMNGTLKGVNNSFIENLTPGVYLLRVNVNGFYFYEKVIVQ